MRERFDLFLISVLLLFLELACIRWFPAHVLFLSFFTNVVLLACFLGMSVGCLAASRRWNYLTWTPVLLVLALLAAQWVESERQRTGSVVDVGNQAAAQLVYFGVEYQSTDPTTRLVIPIEAVSGFLFVLIALVMIGPGQQLGRLLSKFPNRVEGYTINIAGSIAGIILFSACSHWQLGPAWWFTGVLATIAYFLIPEKRLRGVVLVGAGVLLPLLASSGLPFTFVPQGGGEEIWSPSYRINYFADGKAIKVNLVGHQTMVSRNTFSPAYELPHLLNRDGRRAPFQRVLIIGAGSGNDVSRAIEWDPRHVDAAEIDPIIYSLGLRDHPDAPYADPRVEIHLGDGRNFLRSTPRQYDLIIYALVDSLVLHSSYSDIRLESYLFTTEAFNDIKQRLRPGGMFVMYNYFRQGWIVARLQAMLEKTFGTGNAVVFNLPGRDRVSESDVLFGEFTVFFAGGTQPIKDAFQQHGEYWVSTERASGPSTPDGFVTPDAATRAAWTAKPPETRTGWIQFRPTTVIPPAAPMKLATDSWPFLYLHKPLIPWLSLRGALIMGTIGALFVLPALLRRTPGQRTPRSESKLGSLGQMFFLGAGFMLIETKAVVHMALLFGSTWTVNSIVFCAVLVMILIANLFVLIRPPKSLRPFYVGLIASLAVSALVPMDAFLGQSYQVQVVGACLLAFAPIAFAGVVFAVSFGQTEDADRAFGANIAGAMCGGLSEYSSMFLGFQYVILVAIAFYALSALASTGRRRVSA